MSSKNDEITEITDKQGSKWTNDDLINSSASKLLDDLSQFDWKSEARKPSTDREAFFAPNSKDGGSHSSYLPAFEIYDPKTENIVNKLDDKIVNDPFIETNRKIRGLPPLSKEEFLVDQARKNVEIPHNSDAISNAARQAYDPANKAIRRK